MVIQGLALWLYAVSRLNKGLLRTAGAWIGLAAQLLEPWWYGKTGLVRRKLWSLLEVANAYRAGDHRLWDGASLRSRSTR